MGIRMHTCSIESIQKSRQDKIWKMILTLWPCAEVIYSKKSSRTERDLVYQNWEKHVRGITSGSNLSLVPVIQGSDIEPTTWIIFCNPFYNMSGWMSICNFDMYLACLRPVICTSLTKERCKSTKISNDTRWYENIASEIVINTL